MLFKWIILIAIAWYIFRAAGNLIAAARGQQPPLGNQQRQRPTPSNNREGPAIRVVKKPSAQSSKSSIRSEDNVEDARFTDL
jgi:hypothetical protein